jgi:hypothetical protein
MLVSTLDNRVSILSRCLSVLLMDEDILYHGKITRMVYIAKPIHAIKLRAVSIANINEAVFDGSIILPPSSDIQIAQNDNDKGNKNNASDTRTDVIPHLDSEVTEVVRA